MSGRRPVTGRKCPVPECGRLVHGSLTRRGLCHVHEPWLTFLLFALEHIEQRKRESPLWTPGQPIK